MPKLKTHSGAKKRVRTTGSGKLIRRRAGGVHFMSKKSASRRRLYGRSQDFNTSDVQTIRRKLGI